MIDFIETVTDRIYASFEEGNKKQKDGNINKCLQTQTIENLDFPGMNVTYLKISRA